MDIFRFRIKCHFLYPMRIHINKFNELKTARIFKWWLMVTHKHYTPCVLYSRSILLWLDTESEQKRVKVTCVYFQWHTHTKNHYFCHRFYGHFQNSGYLYRWHRCHFIANFTFHIKMITGENCFWKINFFFSRWKI